MKGLGLLRFLAGVVLLSLVELSVEAGVDWPDQVEVGQLLILDAPPNVACTWEVSGHDVDGDPYEPAWREFPGAVVVETRYGGSLTVSLKTNAKRGLMNVVWCVGVGDDPGGDDPGDDPDDEIDSLVRFVMKETAKVETNPIERGEVAAIFGRLVERIENGDLRGSSAVMTATKATMFEDDTVRSNWQQWYTLLAKHLLDELQLVTQSQFAVAYKKIAQGVVQ